MVKGASRTRANVCASNARRPRLLVCENERLFWIRQRSRLGVCLAHHRQRLFLEASVAERQGCAPALTREITVVSDLFPLLYARFRGTLAEAIRHTAAVGEFSVARRSDASLSGTKPLRLGTSTCGRPSRGRITRSVCIVGGSQSGRQTRSEAILDRGIRKKCEKNAGVARASFRSRQ